MYMDIAYDEKTMYRFLTSLGMVVQWIHALREMPTLHTGIPDPESCSFWCSWEAQGMAEALGFPESTGKSHTSPGSWCWPGPAMTVPGIISASIPLSLCFSNA